MRTEVEQVDLAVVTRGREDRSTGIERDAPGDAVTTAILWTGDRSACIDAPQDDRTVEPSRREQRAVRAEGDAEHVPMVRPELVYRSPCGHVPQHDQATVAADGEESAVRAEREAQCGLAAERFTDGAVRFDVEE